MAKAKTAAQKKAGGGRRGAPKKADEDLPSDVEVVEEVVESEGDAGSDAEYKGRGSRRAGKTTKKSTTARSKRDTKSKDYKEEDEDDVEEEVEEEPEKPAPKPKKAPAKKAVELAFSKNEEAPDAKDEIGEEENSKEATDEELAEDSKEEDAKGAGKSAGRPKKAKRGRPKGKGPSKKPKVEDEEEEEEDEDKEYEVEKILEVRTHKTKPREFLVKWKGFSIERSTWEPEENLQHATDLVEAFLAKVNKGDLPRTRRLSTIQSTKSSSSSLALKKARQGRVTKSRSRTPSRRGSVPKLDHMYLINEESTAPSPFTMSRKPNGDLSLHKFMRESVERKLELLKEKERPKPDSTLGRVQEIYDEDTEEEAEKDEEEERPAPTIRMISKNGRKRRFGTMARALVGVGAAAASAAALFFTSPETLNWEHISPHIQQWVQNVQEGYSQIIQNVHR